MPIDGLASFRDKSNLIAYGENCKALAEDRVASSQCLSGTGGLRVIFEFLRYFGPNKEKTVIHVPNPTWGNHNAIIKNSGLSLNQYKYYNSKKIEAEVDYVLEDLNKANPGDAVLLHSCAHNPTGCDLSEEAWEKVNDVISRKRLIPIFDTAYQGFATGDLDRDASALRMFEKKGNNIIVCQSYAKNLGLYGQRVGNLSFVCGSPEEKERVLSQVKIVIRTM